MNTMYQDLPRIILFCSAGFMLMPDCLAQDAGPPLRRQTMTAYVKGSMGYNTYESQTAGAKETASSSSWTIGTFAGRSRTLGFSFSSSENIVPFSLNGSTMASHWQDLKIQARMGWFYPIVAATLSDVTITRNNETAADIYGAAIGGGLGLHVPLWNRVVVAFETVTFGPPNGGNNQLGKMGQRTDSTVEASMDLTKEMIDLIVGYQIREFKISTPENEQQERQLGAFAGLRLGFYF